MMAAPNITHIEYLFQVLDFRMKSLSNVFSQEMIEIDHAVETCREMTVVHGSRKNQQEYFS